jgi:polysaccharide biosynthesis protein PslH
LPADSRPAAILLAPEAPYPLAGGGALRTASLLEYLARRYEIDLIVFRQPGDPDPEAVMPAGLTRRIVVIDLPSNRRTVAAKAVRTAVRLARAVPPLVDRFAGYQPRIAQAVEGRHYDLGVVEHFWCAPYWEQLAPVCRRTVLDLHNIESMLHARCARVEAAAPALAHRVFQRVALELERLWLPRYSQVLATSDRDAAAVREIAPQAKVSVYRNALPRTAVPPRVEENVVVFSGNMEYHPNISAVRYFRREIWPLLRGRWPGLIWRLIGKNAAAVRAYTSGDPRIDVKSEIADAVFELARCKVAVVPLLSGSGTRLKILEAWAAGLPVVSTTLGAEGLPVRDGEQLLLADGAPEFADAVSRLLACTDLRKSVGLAGRLLMENEFTWDAAWKDLDF